MTLSPVRNSPATSIDCRGQRCPAPILATAKAARSLGSTGGGTLEIVADDQAFPLDIRSWCRSAGAELLALSDEAGVHTAVVQVGGRPTQGTVRGLSPISPPRAPAVPPSPPSTAASSGGMVVDLPAVLDCRGQRCPAPILALARRARALGAGARLEVIADDPAFKLDLESWCRSSKASLISLTDEGQALRALLQLPEASDGAVTTPIATRPSPVPAPAPAPAPAPVQEQSTPISLNGVPLDDRLSHIEQRVTLLAQGSRIRVLCEDTTFSVPLVQWGAASGHRLLSLEARGPLEAEFELAGPPPTTALAPVESPQIDAIPRENVCTLLVLHNDKEALLAALLVAVGAASQGMDVMMFYTFWGLNLLRGDEPNAQMPKEKVSWSQRMFKWMMPRGPRRQKLGKLNMGGIGGGMLGSIMKRYELMDVPDLLATAEEQGVRFVACTMSMQVMGITKRDLAPRENLEYGGVAAFVESAARSRMSLTF